MKTKFISIVLCLAVLLSMIPVSYAAATQGSCGKNMTWSFNPSTGHLTISGSGIMDDNTPWKKFYAKEIYSASIGYGVENISDFAFYNCVNLKTISIPSSLKEIGEYGFYNSGLESITIPDSVTKIRKYAFAECAKLVLVKLSSNLKDLGERAFFSCESLTSIALPGSLKTVPGECFKLNRNLKNVTLAEGIESIGGHAFSACGVEYLKLPSTIKVIQAYAFKGSGIREITIPEKVTKIEEYTFEQCSKLTTVNIPCSVKEIKTRAFSDCDSLERVILPAYLESLASDTFVFSDNLKYVVFLNRNTKIHWDIANPHPTLVGYLGSTAQQYAQEYDYRYLPLSYYDVMPWEWYYQPIQDASEAGLMNGVATNKFDPEGITSRAMLVTILWRYAGEVIEGENTFADVAESQWYTDAVVWAAHNQIVNGVAENRFDPNTAVTREQVALILYRYCTAMGYDTTLRADLNAFPDHQKVSSWAQEALSWAVAEGLISGSSLAGALYLQPQNGATRAQIATILTRFAEKHQEIIEE